ncbi:Pathogen-related protein [Dendrobium catenatum]|uniref:Pathogen-related protein n=1 Tax=Dendrobium catenatum TaxID=906689 RepID=A0A2I0VNV0_9ASPA|nr:Pathogen-related protein [Dendrobium catenatum]
MGGQISASGFNNIPKQRPLIIREGSLLNKVAKPVTLGKGKETLKVDDFLSPRKNAIQNTFKVVTVRVPIGLEALNFQIRGKELTIQKIGKIGGGYNAFLQTKLPKELRIYDPQQETFSTSHELFTIVFPRGFALEILEVLSGTPRIVYKFRHWGFMEVPFKGNAPIGEKVEVYGMSIFHVSAITIPGMPLFLFL